MSNSEFGLLTLQLSVLLAAALSLGELFRRMRQPRVIGEIAAGVLVGLSVLGHFAPALAAHLFPAPGATSGRAAVVEFIYNLGLLLLMFASGAETRSLFHRDDRRAVAWLGTVGTGLPFLIALLAAPLIPFQRLMGSAQNRASALLVIAIAVAVTSIPVISRILHDLGVLHTRFARLVLGVAVLEDIALWAVLAIATALATHGNVPRAEISRHVAITIAYFALGLLVAPRLLRFLGSAPWNTLARTSPVGYAMVVLLAYTALADALGVNLVFAAFLAGFALSTQRETHWSDALATINKFAFAVFIPLYFAVVGYRLDLSRNLSLSMLLVFLVLACVLKLLASGAGARLAGFELRDCLNLAVATNARGGPGIVLASVAYDAGIINAAFYTTLVLVAVLTSQLAGWWLGAVLRNGEALLQPAVAEQAMQQEGGDELAALINKPVRKFRDPPLLLEFRRSGSCHLRARRVTRTSNAIGTLFGGRHSRSLHA
ncbi:MAG TPA: cation:proton antiporter [Terriglobales bacterium]